MAVLLNPYLTFRDEARDALAFYENVFGGTGRVMTFAEGGMPYEPAEADKVMHAQLDVANGITLMLSDVPALMPWQPGGNVSVSLSGDDDATLRGYWTALMDGGTETMPLAVAPWGDAFGMGSDRFGITWYVNITTPGE